MIQLSQVSGIELFLAFLICHAFGDYVLQADFLA